MKKYFFKKIITILIIVSFFTPRSSDAIFGIGDIVSDPITNAEQILSMLKEYGLDSLASTLLGTMSTKITNKVFNKANGGASGDNAQPSYIQNFGKYFSDLQMGQIDKFVTDLGVSNNPFASDIAQSLIKNVQRGGNGLSGFNLDTVIGPNWKDFSTDASVGGWDGFLALSNPANTNIGSALLAKQDLANQIEQEIENEKTKLVSPGTKPQGKCNLNFSEYKNNIQKVKTGRNLINNIQNTTFDGIGTDENGNTIIVETGSNGLSDANSVGSDILAQSGGTAEGLQDLYSNTQQNNQNIAVGLAEDYGVCLDELINNPVGLVTNTINSALDSAQQKLANGDEIGELIAGALLQMTNTFIKGGLSSLTADFQTNRDAIGGPEQLVAKNGQNIPWTQTPNLIIDLPEEFQPAITATENEVENLRNYLKKISTPNDTGNESFATVITELDQCVPGPDYGFKKRLTAYVSRQTKRLDKRKDKGKDWKQIMKNNTLENIDTSVDTAKIAMELALSDKSRNIPAAGTMLAEVATIDEIRLKYQDTKSELVKKQITLNLLYSIESALQGSIQSLRVNIPSLPSLVPFTINGWGKMSETQRTTAVLWAKNMVVKIPKTTPVLQITPNDIPLTSTDWDALSTAKKSELVRWAKTISDKKTSTSDKDFVLGVVTFSLGLSQNNTTKRDFLISTVWKVWSNPENYITIPWGDSPVNSQPSVGTVNSQNNTVNAEQNFLNKKNEIRSNYNALQNDVSIPYTAQKAESALKQLDVIINQATKLRDDCQTLRTIVGQNRLNTEDPEAHNKLQTILEQNINKFKSQEMREAIKFKDGILAKQPVLSPSDFVEFGVTCDDRGCYDGSDLVHPQYGDEDVSDGGAELSEDQKKLLTKYQVSPAKNIWELLDQKNGDADTAFCSFNSLLKIYPIGAPGLIMLPNSTLDGGRSIDCSTDWNRVDKTTIRTIIFSTDIKDSF
jgi:hypothetical protein